MLIDLVTSIVLLSSNHSFSLVSLQPVIPQMTEAEKEQDEVNRLVVELLPFFTQQKNNIEKAIEQAKREKRPGLVVFFKDEGYNTTNGFTLPFKIILVSLREYFKEHGYKVEIHTEKDIAALQILW